jgi:hypothetical protein
MIPSAFVDLNTFMIPGDYNPHEYFPPLPESDSLPQESPQMTLSMPDDYKSQLIQRESDGLRLQTENPLVGCMIRYVQHVEHKSKEVEQENNEIKKCLQEHADAIFMSIAMKLFSIIRESPKLTQRLHEMRLEEKYIDLNTLIHKLEASATNPQSKDWVIIETEQDEVDEDGWTIMESKSTHKCVQINGDMDILGELEHQINGLQKALDGNKQPKEFMIEIEKLRKEAINTHYLKTWTRVYNAGANTLTVLQGLYWVANLLISVSPTILAFAPLIFPLNWLTLLQMFVAVIKSVPPKV